MVRQSPGHWGGTDKGGAPPGVCGCPLITPGSGPAPKHCWEPRGKERRGSCAQAPAEPPHSRPCQPPTGTKAEVPGGRLDPWPGPQRAGRAPGASRPTPCHRRLRQPEHKILQQLRSCGNDVFVVTEVLQTQEEVEVTWAQKQEGCGQFALPGALRLQVRGVGRGRAGVGEAGGSGRAWAAGI